MQRKPPRSERNNNNKMHIKDPLRTCKINPEQSTLRHSLTKQLDFKVYRNRRRRERSPEGWDSSAPVTGPDQMACCCGPQGGRGVAVGLCLWDLLETISTEPGKAVQGQGLTGGTLLQNCPRRGLGEVVDGWLATAAALHHRSLGLAKPRTRSFWPWRSFRLSNQQIKRKEDFLQSLLCSLYWQSLAMRRLAEKDT